MQACSCAPVDTDAKWLQNGNGSANVRTGEAGGTSKSIKEHIHVYVANHTISGDNASTIAVANQGRWRGLRHGRCVRCRWTGAIQITALVHSSAALEPAIPVVV